MEKCYSIDGSSYCKTSLYDVLAEFDADDRLSEGVVYYEANLVRKPPSFYFDISTLVYEMNDFASILCGGDFTESFPDISKQDLSELNDMIKGWLDKKLTTSFWIATNAIQMKVTQQNIEMFASTKGLS